MEGVGREKDTSNKKELKNDASIKLALNVICLNWSACAKIIQFRKRVFLSSDCLPSFCVPSLLSGEKAQSTSNSPRKARNKLIDQKMANKYL